MKKRCWIQNISLKNFKEGNHLDPKDNSILIQILDPGMEFPESKFKFHEIHKFEFLDLEEKDDGFDDGFKITDKQAFSLITILSYALENNMNVIVHCVAGFCRSGAVAEVGILMGFQDSGSYRQPNCMVKNKMLKVLGLTYG